MTAQTNTDAPATDCPGCGAGDGFHADLCTAPPLTLTQVVLARRLVVAVEDQARSRRQSLVSVRVLHRLLDAETERLAVQS